MSLTVGAGMSKDDVNRAISELRDEWDSEDTTEFEGVRCSTDWHTPKDWHSPANAMMLLKEMLLDGHSFFVSGYHTGGFSLRCNHCGEIVGPSLESVICTLYEKWKRP